MKENFEKILDFTLKHEGGLVNDSADPGGITNFGISFRFLRGINPDAEESDIENMTVSLASELYRKHFWEACKCDDVPHLIDAVVFDTAVNMGTGSAIKMLQKTLNDIYDVNLLIDGGFGPVTAEAVENIADNIEFTQKYLNFRREFYNSLAESKPKFKKFLKGWLNRVDHLEKFVSENPNHQS